MTDYLTALKDIVDSLDAINSSITYLDLTIQALIGLSFEYDSFITTYGNNSNYDFDDLRTKLLVLEQLLSRRT